METDIAKAREVLNRDGAAVIRGAVPAVWIDRMREAIEAELAGASPTAA